MAAKNKLINLLPQDEFDVSLTGRVLKWAMGTFRIIVIFVEIVVMGSFLSRFWLDARNSDLNEEIGIKTAQIKSQNDFEKEFRSLQDRLSIFKEMSKNKKPSETLSKVSDKLPPDVLFTSVSFQDSTAQIKGTSGSELGIAQLISNLDADESFKDVSLGQLTQSEENSSLISFTIDLKY